MEHLYQKLARYSEEGIYPYHMPGHKRRGLEGFPEEAYGMDITEIEGFDNLHQPEGIIREVQERAARLYGAEESFYLVGGSTCGVLAAVSSVVPLGGHILMSRSCHKSAYHAVYLRNLTVSYLSQPYLEEYGILDAVTPQQVERELGRAGDIDAVLIVSPTYEGRIADVAGIADIVHKKGIPLIVDEAHGAHLGLAEGFPPNSCQAGADLVIHSVHKTLPALTQTALLHVNGRLADRERLWRFLNIYQSSSPSYLLMGSIDRALHYVEVSGEEAFARFRKLYGDMITALAACRHLKILSGDSKVQDVGKLIVSVGQGRITGRQLYDVLLQKYRLQLEMASETFVLAMFTVNDGQEAYERMTRALLEIDDGLEEGIYGNVPKGEGNEVLISVPEREGVEVMTGFPGVPESCGDVPGKCHGARLQSRIPLARAWDMEAKSVPLEESVGRYAAEFVNLYPPGVPLLVPGEPVTEELLRDILRYVKTGLSVQGILICKGEEALERRILLKVLER